MECGKKGMGSIQVPGSLQGRAVYEVCTLSWFCGKCNFLRCSVFNLAAKPNVTEKVTNSLASPFPEVPCLADPLVLQPTLGVARLCAGHRCCQISLSLGLSPRWSRCPKMWFRNIHNSCSWCKKGKERIFAHLSPPRLYLCCWLPVASSTLLKSTTAWKNRAILLEAFHIFMLAEALDKIKF